MSETKPVLWNRNFVQCCISYFLMNFAFYMLMPTMPVYLVEELGISTSEVGMVLSSCKHSKKCTFYTLRFGCSFAAVNTIKPQLL